MNTEDLEVFRDNIEQLRLNADYENFQEFSHILEETYLDFAANGIYMNSLVRDYYQKLTNQASLPKNPDVKSPWCLFSNPHSHSQSGVYTNIYVELTRQKILRLFNTNQSQYDVIFTSNATQALKLLAESFNFSEEISSETDVSNTGQSSSFVYLNDNHTSVIGMRELVWNNINTDVYCLIEDDKTNNFSSAKYIPSPYNMPPSSKPIIPRNLIVYPAQSNFNGRKYDLDRIEQIRKNGLEMEIIENDKKFNKKFEGEWFVCLDTASYTCTSYLDLSKYKPDFLVVSFYKIFGFPTGIGALIVKKDERIKNCLNKKCYFGGGTVSMALIDDNKVCLKNSSCRINGKQTIEKLNFHDSFEDGTLSYLQIIGVSLAIDKFDHITKGLGLRVIEPYVKSLADFCVNELKRLNHHNSEPLVEMYRRTDAEHGPIIAFNLKNSNGNYIGYSLVDKLAQENKIHLRTGCFCNIGACQMFMKHLKDNKNFLENFQVHGHKCGDYIDLINGMPTGAIRISFGYCSIRKDVEKFIKFLKDNFLETNKDDQALFEPVKQSADGNNNNIQKQFFKITRIYLYPIKSCGPMRIENSWPISEGKVNGLLYDHNWIIVDNNMIPLIQKRLPALTKIFPLIDLQNELLKLIYEDKFFNLSLNVKEDSNNLVHIYTNNLAGYDQGDEVSDWLTDVLNLKEKCRLVKVASEQESDNPEDGPVKTSFVNKGDYLLINEVSVRQLRNFLLDSLPDDEAIPDDESILRSIDEFLLLQFRANIIVSTLNQTDEEQTKFQEESWTKMKILNKTIELSSMENCSRCQMININQSSNKTLKQNDKSSPNKEIDVAKLCNGLLKQLYKFKSNSKFGIYVSKTNESTLEISTKELDISSEASENYSIFKNKELTVGDIGVAFYGSDTPAP